MDVIILAGGFGTRLKDVVHEVPKSMAPINGIPFLTYILNYLYNYNVNTIVMAVGYKRHQIMDHYGYEYRGMKIRYSIEREPLGTGGAIKKAMKLVTTDNVLVLNGDVYAPIKLDEIMKKHEEHQAKVTMAVKPMQHVSRYGIVDFDDNRIKRFEEKKPVDFGYINTATYVMNKKFLNSFDTPNRFSMEQDLFANTVSDYNYVPYVYKGYFMDIGIPKDYQKFEEDMEQIRLKKR